MRLIFPVAIALALAACATAPREVTPAPATSTAAVVRPTGALVGLSVSELIARFGQPALQVREGPGLKLQWAGASCVLDAFLYASAGGHERATHVEARRPTGDPLDAQSCALALAR
jgi:hypothetical protein